MENAIWKGQGLLTGEVARSYEVEKMVRQESGHKELCCTDLMC